MNTFNTILFSIWFAVLSCVVNVSSVQACQFADCSGAFDSSGPASSNSFSSGPSMPLSPDPSGRYQRPESQADFEYRNQHSSGQQHTPPVERWSTPSTETFSVYPPPGSGGRMQTCTRSGNSVFCQ